MAMQALPAGPDDVPGDSNDGHRPKLVALDDGHAFEVDIAPPDAERLTNAHAGAEHEGDDVREVTPARAGLGASLFPVLRGTLHPRQEPAAFLRGQCPGLARAGLDRVQVPDRV